MDREEKSQLSPEALQEKIVSIVNRIKTDSDSNPVELEEIKKIIRKNVPFFMRGAFSAYILRELLNSNEGRNGKPQRERKDRRESKFQSVPLEKAAKPQPRKNDVPKKPVEMPATDVKPQQNAEPQVKKEEKEERVIPEGAKTLYLNVGKMKRLYAKNLSQILQAELEITREDIYSLRVHDKYSFITMSEENCEKAIEKLNGKDINGRTAMLSYSNR